MYLYDTLDNKRAKEEILVKTLVTLSELEKTSKVEVWASNFNDHGKDDFIECRFFSKDSDTPYKVKRINGY